MVSCSNRLLLGADLNRSLGPDLGSAYLGERGQSSFVVNRLSGVTAVRKPDGYRGANRSKLCRKSITTQQNRFERADLCLFPWKAS